MTLWLLRPAWVSFKSDRNCRLQKLWLAEKAIWKKTSNDVCVHGCECVQETKPAPFARQAGLRKVLRNHKISSNPICRHEKCHQGEMGCFQESSGWIVSAFVGRLLAVQRILPALQDNSSVSEHSISTSALNRAVPHSLFCLQHKLTAKYYSKILTLKSKINKKKTGKSKKKEANL